MLPIPNRRVIARSLLVFSLPSLVVACASPEVVVDEAEWQGSVETDGNVTTVRNVSGSVWGGDATMVEELSIGVDLGEGPYMFGQIAGIWGTSDRIYVADARPAAIRVFDSQGGHVMDIGRQGEGPGEFQLPNSVVVAGDGRIYAKDGMSNGKVYVYAPDGTPVDTLIGDPRLGSGWPLVLTRDGSVYTPVMGGTPDDEPRRSAMAIPGLDGMIGDPILVPTLGYESEGVRVNERARLNVPFAPRFSWAMSPSGAIVAGITSEYRFEIHHPDGSVTVVERDGDAIPVDPDEREWQRRSTVRGGRNFQEGWQWDGAEIPDTMPAWSTLKVDADGRVWVRRNGPRIRVEDCDPDPMEVVNGRPRPCWRSDAVYDVFGEDGRFLGAVSLPVASLNLRTAYISGTTVLAQYENEAGVGMVKRYRLVLPEG
jgi:hypothetical protein